MGVCFRTRGKALIPTSMVAIFLAGSIFLGGCDLIHTRQGNDLVIQNNARFLHAYRDARKDLSRDDFEKAGNIASLWEKYPHLNAENRHLLSGLIRQVRREQAIYRMGEARQLEAVGHLNEALDMVDHAAKLDPSWPIPQRARHHLVILIEVQNQIGHQWESLVRRLLVLRKSEPSNPELDRTLSWAYFHLANSRFSSDHFSGAYRWVNKSLLLDPGNSEGKQLKARILEKVNGDTDEGEVFFRKNRIGQSIMAFRKALLIRPNDPRARKDLSMALEAQALGAKHQDAGEKKGSKEPSPRL